MPVYEYRCQDCGEVWERQEHISEHEEVVGRNALPPNCPHCEGQKVEPVFSAFFAKTSRKS
jgi:putative FmdB family regulatory protein